MIYIYMYIYCVYNMYIHVHIYIYTNMYIYIWIRTDTHIYICIHTCFVNMVCIYIYMDWWWMGRSIETYTDGWIDAPNTICVDVLWRLLQCGKTNQIPLVWKWEVYVHLGAMGFLWGIELELHGIMCAKSQTCKSTYESHTSGDYFSLRQICGGPTIVMENLIPTDP